MVILIKPLTLLLCTEDHGAIAELQMKSLKKLMILAVILLSNSTPAIAGYYEDELLFSETEGMTQRCREAARSVEDNLFNRFALEHSFAGESYHPQVEGSQELVFVVTGNHGNNILNSPVLMREMAQPVLNSCQEDGFNSVSFAYASSGWFFQFGYVNGEFKQFECIEDVLGGDAFGDVNTPRLPWGYQYCSH
jgi:hypothetical protein